MAFAGGKRVFPVLVCGVLACLSLLQGAPESPVNAKGEFWPVLYGHCERSRNNLPAFQISGPRLTASGLKNVLNARRRIAPADPALLLKTL